MNQRIQELIKLSTTVEYGVDNGFDRVTINQEKFAELIIRECVNNLFSNGHDDAAIKLQYLKGKLLSKVNQ